jgi:hypothetical protein
LTGREEIHGVCEFREAKPASHFSLHFSRDRTGPFTLSPSTGEPQAVEAKPSTEKKPDVLT